MLSRHLSMNFVRNLALSPAGSFARRSAARRRSSFVGTLVFCWRLRLRNFLNASWSEGPVSRSSSCCWPLAAIKGAMGCGQPTSESVEGQAAPRRQSDGYGLPCDTGTDCRPAGQIPNDASRAAAIAAIHEPPCRPQQLGRRLHSGATRTKLAAVRY